MPQVLWNCHKCTLIFQEYLDYIKSMQKHKIKICSIMKMFPKLIYTLMNIFNTFVPLLNYKWNIGGLFRQFRSLLIQVAAHLVAQNVKYPPAMQETWVQSLGWEDPLEKGMATLSSILVWWILWMEEPGGPQSMGSQCQVWATKHSTSQ